MGFEKRNGNKWMHFLALFLLFLPTGAAAQNWEYQNLEYLTIDKDLDRENSYISDTKMDDQWFCGQNGEDSEVPSVSVAPSDLDLKHLLSGNDSVLSVKIPDTVDDPDYAGVTFYYGGDVGQPLEYYGGHDLTDVANLDYGNCVAPDIDEACNETIHRSIGDTDPSDGIASQLLIAEYKEGVDPVLIRWT